jgi:hypothetical protein
LRVDLVIFVLVGAAHVAGSIWDERWWESYYVPNLLRPPLPAMQTFYTVFEFPANLVEGLFGRYYPQYTPIYLYGEYLWGKPLSIWLIFDLPCQAAVFVGLNAMAWGMAAVLLLRLCTFCISRFRNKDTRGFDVVLGGQR